MISAELPSDEVNRLWALYNYEILDTEPEAIFDQLTELAASICEAPIALISLVDRSRQWFKSHVGIDATETARRVSFCAHAILQPNVFVVPDTLLDERFADNPLVTGPPKIRFYAGAPLFTEAGQGLGTLCVIDTQPRQLSAAHEKALKVLRNHVVQLFELRLKTRELEQANRELDSYNYAVSHDLRVPLRAVMGFSDILLEDHGAELSEGALGLVGQIRDAGMRMQQLIADLLYLSRVLRAQLQFGEVNVTQIATDVVTALQQADPSRKVEVVIAPSMVICADARLLRIALENLLNNAWKFTGKCPVARIEVGQEKLDGTSQFYVRDNGAGFNMRYASRLFQPFQRLHSSGEYEGTGVGLATVKRIIQRHGGRVWAQGALNEGATIYFTLGSELLPPE
jgi:signal transduction histidine kinase